MKQLHDLVMTRTSSREAFGFRIIGGKDEGQTFKVEKVLTGYPADYAGLKPHDFLVSVQGQEIFDFNHKQVVELIKAVGNTLNITIERGDHIVPNFEEIWPSGRNKGGKGYTGPEKGPQYYLHAMQCAIPGERDKIFSTVGKPKVTVTQYDNPINCYSDETIDEMTEGSTTWKKTDEQVSHIPPDPNKFNPAKSAVLAVLTDHEKGVTFAR